MGDRLMVVRYDVAAWLLVSALGGGLCLWVLWERPSGVSLLGTRLWRSLRSLRRLHGNRPEEAGGAEARELWRGSGAAGGGDVVRNPGAGSCRSVGGAGSAASVGR